MAKPDYENYTIAELLNCREQIDTQAWPERYQEIRKYIAIRQQDPKQNRIHDEIVFANFCQALSYELSCSIDDNLWPLLKVFSKSARSTKPAAFEDKVCPVCSGDLDVSHKWGRWKVFCYACNIGYAFQENHQSNLW